MRNGFRRLMPLMWISSLTLMAQNATNTGPQSGNSIVWTESAAKTAHQNSFRIRWTGPIVRSTDCHRPHLAQCVQVPV